MLVALSLSGTDAGRSGLGVYLSSILPHLAARLRAGGAELLAAGSPADLAAYRPALALCPGASEASLPDAVDRPALGSLWHLGLFGLWAAARGARVALLPAANRRLSAGPLPTVSVVHDLAPILVPGKYDALRVAYARAAVAPALARSRRLVAVSRATEADLHRVVGDLPVDVIPNGVDCSRFRPVPRENRENPYIIYASRLEHPGKNHARLIDAFARSSAARTHRLRLVGGDWGARASLESQVEALGLAGRVVFEGRVGDEAMPGLIGGADAAVMVGLREGFGLPVLEALACGVPVLVADAGALPEVAGPLGVLCDPLDIDSIRAGLDRACSDEQIRARARAEGPARARSFSWQSAGERLAQVCMEAAA